LEQVSDEWATVPVLCGPKCKYLIFTCIVLDLSFFFVIHLCRDMRLKYALVTAFAVLGEAANFTIINGQIFTPGLAIVDAPQPNTPLGGGMFVHV
jgi:hypothetical protein